VARPAPAPEATRPRELAGECPRCGSAYAPLQEYCLECGLRLDEDPFAEPPRGPFAALGDAWIWPSLVALVVAAIAIAVVLAGHVRMALGDRDALRGMVRGWVPADWARRHRPRWYEEQVGERDPTRSG
jgi:hypothetical protein